MPQVAIHLALYERVQLEEDPSDGVRVDIPPICLPSGLPAELRAALPPQHNLIDKERRLRRAQCDDALFELRRHLRIRASAFRQKKKSTRGQRESTRAQAVLSQFTSKIDLIAERYREAFAALQVLDTDPNAEWRIRLRPLRNEDIRPMHADSDDDDDNDDDNARKARRSHKKRKRKGDGYHTPSWIYMVSRTDGEGRTKEELGTGMCNFFTTRAQANWHCTLAYRVEWAKAQARSQRWQEEVELINEEMRRVLVYCDYASEIWKGRIGLRSDLSSALDTGMRAYALKQASMWRRLGIKFAGMWYRNLTNYKFKIEWPTHFIAAGVTASNSYSSKKTTFVSRLNASEGLTQSIADLPDESDLATPGSTKSNSFSNADVDDELTLAALLDFL